MRGEATGTSHFRDVLGGCGFSGGQQPNDARRSAPMEPDNGFEAAGSQP